MATLATSADSLKTIDAMWAGTLISLGQYFRDPKVRGPQMKDVVAGTSRKYRDALDNLETEILDAKWLLEYDLKKLRAKREAAKQAAAPPTTTKRKFETLKESDPSAGELETSSKRQKADISAPSDAPSTTLTASNDTGSKDMKPNPNEKAEQEKPIPAPSQDTAKGISTSENPADRGERKGLGMPLTGNSDEKLEGRAKEKEETTEDVAASEVPLSAGADINFDSIFGSPPGDENTTHDLDLALDASGDLSHDQGADEGMGNRDSLNTAEDPTPLNTLLPGLDAYANATGDDFSMLNASGADAGATSVSNLDSNPFDLPALDETNDFDSFLRDNSFDQPPGSEDKKGDEFLNDDSMLNLDGELDDSWFA